MVEIDRMAKKQYLSVKQITQFEKRIAEIRKEKEHIACAKYPTQKVNYREMVKDGKGRLKGVDSIRRYANCKSYAIEWEELFDFGKELEAMKKSNAKNEAKIEKVKTDLAALAKQAMDSVYFMSAPEAYSAIMEMEQYEV